MRREEITKNCLIEMFMRVGLDYSFEQILEYSMIHGDRWFRSRTWTSQEDAEFRQWTDTHLRTKTKWGACRRKNEIGMFMLMWGWKIED